MFEALQVVTSTLVKLEHVPKDTKQELRKEAFSGVSKLFNVHHGKLAHLNQQMLELFSGAIENSSNVISFCFRRIKIRKLYSILLRAFGIILALVMSTTIQQNGTTWLLPSRSCY